MLKLSDKNVNKKMYKDYLQYLLEKYSHINCNIINNNPYLHFSCFFPLPYSLEINHYDDNDKTLKHGDIYEFIGIQSNHRIFFANRLLPNPYSDPIPFTMPIKINSDTVELINSNCFYYEITIDERIRDPWQNETISIGYGSIITPIKCNPGWVPDTIGYHLDDGSMQHNQIIIKKYGPICKIGDTIGAILVYISLNNYKVFFTFNGSLIVNNIFHNNFNIKLPIVPIIGYNHSCKIKVNFGNEIFKFDIKNFCNSNFIISQNNQFINDHAFINKINTDTIIQKKIKNNTFSPNNDVSIFTPSFSIFNDNILMPVQIENAILNIIADNNIN